MGRFPIFLGWGGWRPGGPIICNDGTWALSEEARLPTRRGREGTHKEHGGLIKCPPEEG